MSTATIEQTRTAPAPRDGRGRAARPAGAVPSTRPAAPRPGAVTTSGPTTGAPRADTGDGGAIAPFVLLTMVLLASGLVATLWLSTAAAADSYRLEEARQVARDLSEQSQRLHREVEGARSAPALAAAARAQGMVPAGDPAVLLVAPNGSSRVIGDARAARGAPRPAAPHPAAPAAAPAPAAPAGPAAPAAPVATDERLRAATVGAG